MKINFYDTSSLLLNINNLFTEDTTFVVSSITLKELEEIKTSGVKDADIKFAARRLLRLLDEHSDKYKVHIFTEDMLEPILAHHLLVNNDMKILATAYHYNTVIEPNNINFVTNDLSLKTLAQIFFSKEDILSVNEDYNDQYVGYQDLTLTDEDLARLYENMNINHFNTLINQYVIIRNSDNEIIDGLVWTGEEYRHYSYDSLDSKQFGRIIPLDITQRFVADSFNHNKITMVKGPAGSGKTLLSLGFLFHQLEKHRIDRIIIFCNTVAAKNAAKLGYLPGTRNEKLLDSQIGNLLISKLGDRSIVERMIDEGILILLPMSDIRGYDTSDLNAGIYISEAQNLDIALMKLALQRIGEDSICIIDGDAKTQVDDINFAGANNGMRRASKVFRNHNIYGEIELKNIYRSEIGQIAEEM